MATRPRVYIKVFSYEEHLTKHLEQALDRLYLNGEINEAGKVTPLGQQYAAYEGWLLGHPTESGLADTGR